MHILQPKHIKLSQKEAEELLANFNIAVSQLPRIKAEDPALPQGCKTGDIIKIERKKEEKISAYFRIVV